MKQCDLELLHALRSRALTWPNRFSQSLIFPGKGPKDLANDVLDILEKVGPRTGLHQRVFHQGRSGDSDGRGVSRTAIQDAATK